MAGKCEKAPLERARPIPVAELLGNRAILGEVINWSVSFILVYAQQWHDVVRNSGGWQGDLGKAGFYLRKNDLKRDY